MPKCFIRIQGLSDQEEWHLLPMTRVGMAILPPLRDGRGVGVGWRA
jgi:hypothetical protein